MDNQRIKRASLVDTVVEQIRALIITDRLAPGTLLPSTADLGKRFQVSRTVLREAISRLESLGLLNVEHGRGIFVGDQDAINKCTLLVCSALSISYRDLVQITEFRRGLECQAARLAVQRAKPEDVATLKTLCDKMDEVDQNDEGGLHADMEFHMKIAELSGNELIYNAMKVIQQFVLVSMARTTPRPRWRSLSIRLHRPIIQAIRNQDPDAAEKAMIVHMDHLIYRLHEVELDQNKNN